jgi:hypothetical protein
MSWVSVRRAFAVVGVCFLVAFAPVSAWAADGPLTGYTCTASSQFDINHAGPLACDGAPAGSINDQHSWATVNVTSGWVDATFPAAVVVTGYSLTGTTDGLVNMPSSWTLAGSADEVAWTTLDSKTGQTFTAGQTISQGVTNTTGYRFYRLTVASAYSPVYLAELGFAGTVATVATTPPPGGSGLPAGTDADPVIVSLPVAFYAFVIGSGSLTVFLLAASLVSRWGA